MKTITALGLLVALGLVAGCATSRSEIQLAAPGAAASTAPATGRVAVIRSVRDERVFEQSPRDPSTPSLGFEGAAQATAETKARAIGRKRGGYGTALGDVLLQNGQTVESVVRDNVAAALGHAGLRVTTDATPPAGALVLDVSIRKFWTWVTPGFWAITLRTNIVTELKAAGSQSSVVATGHAEQGSMAITDGTWIETVDKALADFRRDLAAKASELR